MKGLVGIIAIAVVLSIGLSAKQSVRITADPVVTADSCTLHWKHAFGEHEGYTSPTVIRRSNVSPQSSEKQRWEQERYSSCAGQRKGDIFLIRWYNR